MSVSDEIDEFGRFIEPHTNLLSTSNNKKQKLHDDQHNQPANIIDVDGCSKTLPESTNNDSVTHLISSTGRIYDSNENDMIVPDEVLNDIQLTHSDNKHIGNTTPTKSSSATTDEPIHCVECDSIRILLPYYQAFHIGVCYSCQREHNDKYALIPKTQCKTDYLLDDKQLSSLLYMMKANPNKHSYSSMKLYRVREIADIAFGMYGDMDGIHAEKIRRETARVRKDEQKHKKQKQREKLERAADEYATAMSHSKINNNNNIHTHTFKQLHGQSQCTQCGFVVDEIEL